MSTHDLSQLPRHLREGLVSLAGRKQGGLSDEGARDLLWDLRKWDGKGEEEEDDWEEEGLDDGAAEDQQGWTTLDLTSTSLPHSTLKQLLLPLHTRPPTPTPVTSLSLAFAASHLNLSTIFTKLPNHLRVLSLAGVRLFPVGSSSSSFPTVSILLKLALATPLLQVGPPSLSFLFFRSVSNSRLSPSFLVQHLDLSWTSPSIKPQEVARLPWTGSKEYWTVLKVLGLRGMEREEVDGQKEVEQDELDARALRVVRSAMKGRRAGWVEVVVS